MTRILFGCLFVSVLVISGCRSHYASVRRPVVYYSPKGLDSVKLTKAVAYALARKRWRITSYDINRVNAQYKRIRIQVNYTVDGSIKIHHLHGTLSGDEAAWLKKWLDEFQHQLLLVSQYDTVRLNQGLRKCSINPENIEKLGELANSREE